MERKDNYLVGEDFDGLPINDKAMLEYHFGGLVQAGGDEKAIRDIVTILGRQMRLAFIDELTGLYNRRGFNGFLGREQSLISRHSSLEHPRPSSLVLFDMDGLKGVNDSGYGHLAGDKVIKDISKIAVRTGREGDLVFRLGGDEFAMILPYANLDNAYGCAESLRKNAEKHEWVYEGKNLGNLTISVGVGNICADRGLDDIFSDADKALYRAKENGKNQVVRAA